MREYDVATDGACLGNPGPGGWAAIVRGEGRRVELADGEAQTTNNRMELRAAIEALRHVGPERARVTIVTDSQYLRQGITSWVAGWQRKGWKTVGGAPVKNRDLWEELVRLTAPHELRWNWTRGHAGHPDNERCDGLAREKAALAASGRLGKTPRPQPPPPDTPAAPAAAQGTAAPVDAARAKTATAAAPPARERAAAAPPPAKPAAAQRTLFDLSPVEDADDDGDEPVTGEPVGPGVGVKAVNGDAGLPAPSVVADALVWALRAEVACERDGEVLRLQTPYPLPDGERLEVWLTALDEGIAVGDGGYAAEQVEVRWRRELDPAATVLPPIARDLDLEWDDRTGVLRYVAPDLAGAITRLPVLARAVARALVADEPGSDP